MNYSLSLNESFTNVLIEFGSILTIVTFLITIILYYIYREKENQILSWIFFICILNFIYAIGILLPINSFCNIQSFLITSSKISQIFYGCLICIFNFYSIKSKTKYLKYISVYRFAFFIFGIIIPLIVSCIIMYTNSYGNSGGYCWIDLYNIYKRTYIKKFVLNLFLLLYFVIVINIFFFIKSKVILDKRIYKNETYNHINNFSILIIISIFPMTLNRIYEVLNKQNQFAILYLLQIIFENFIGPILNILLITSPWIKNNILDSIYIYHQNNELNYPNELLFNRQSSIDDYKNSLNTNKRYSIPIKKNSEPLLFKHKIKNEIFIDSNDNQDIDNNDFI